MVWKLLLKVSKQQLDALMNKNNYYLVLYLKFRHDNLQVPNIVLTI